MQTMKEKMTLPLLREPSRLHSSCWLIAVPPCKLDNGSMLSPGQFHITIDAQCSVVWHLRVLNLFLGCYMKYLGSLIDACGLVHPCVHMGFGAFSGPRQPNQLGLRAFLRTSSWRKRSECTKPHINIVQHVFYPLVNKQFAIENSHRNSGCSH
jgi:hypothetical protein